MPPFSLCRSTRSCALCDTIVASGPGYFRDRSGQDEVALWGYHQLQAVARAAHLFARLDYVRACAATVRTLVEPVVADGFYHVYPRQRNMQCAYSVSSLVLGLEELYGMSGQAPEHRPDLHSAVIGPFGSRQLRLNVQLMSFHTGGFGGS